MRYVIIHDQRVRTIMPTRPNLGLIQTDATTRLRDVFGRINALAKPTAVRALFILAHGKAGFNARPAVDETHEYMRPGGICMDAGGMGVSLGYEGIRHDNVDLWSAIRGRVANIVLFSCAAADTQPGNQGTVADGRYLMGALAIRTRANVYASNRIQHLYLAGGFFSHPVWDGDLMRFGPRGERGVKVTDNYLPFDFDYVVSGDEP